MAGLGRRHLLGRLVSSMSKFRAFCEFTVDTVKVDGATVDVVVEHDDVFGAGRVLLQIEHRPQLGRRKPDRPVVIAIELDLPV